MKRLLLAITVVMVLFTEDCARKDDHLILVNEGITLDTVNPSDIEENPPAVTRYEEQRQESDHQQTEAELKDNIAGYIDRKYCIGIGNCEYGFYYVLNDVIGGFECVFTDVDGNIIEKCNLGAFMPIKIDMYRSGIVFYAPSGDISFWSYANQSILEIAIPEEIRSDKQWYFIRDSLCWFPNKNCLYYTTFENGINQLLCYNMETSIKHVVKELDCNTEEVPQIGNLYGSYNEEVLFFSGFIHSMNAKTGNAQGCVGVINGDKLTWREYECNRLLSAREYTLFLPPKDTVFYGKTSKLIVYRDSINELDIEGAEVCDICSVSQKGKCIAFLKENTNGTRTLKLLNTDDGISAIKTYDDYLNTPAIDFDGRVITYSTSSFDSTTEAWKYNIIFERIDDFEFK